MTPTLAPGARARRPGFTLVELMVTITVIGLAASVVALSLPDPRPDALTAAERLAARLIHAREDAMLTNRPVAARLDAQGYAFVQMSGGEWSAVAEGPLRRQAWPEGVSPNLAGDAERLILFDPSGLSAPATIELRAEQPASVRIDDRGRVQVHG